MEYERLENDQTPANDERSFSPEPDAAVNESLPRLDFRALSRREQISAVEALLFASEEPLTAQMMYEILVVGDDGDKNEKEKNEKEKNEKEKNEKKESEKKERATAALAVAHNGALNGAEPRDNAEDSHADDGFSTDAATHISYLRAAPPKGMTTETRDEIPADAAAEETSANSDGAETPSVRQTSEAEEWIEGLIAELNAELAATARAFRVVSLAREGAKGFQFATNPEHGELLAHLVKSKSKKRLSKAGLETLAIVAYRQPISKPEVEIIRGVSSSEIINRLLEKNLITIVGRSESVGKPLLYGTTDEFLRLFGLHSLADLPKPRELEELMAERADILETERPAVTISATTAPAVAASLQDSLQDFDARADS